MPSFLYISLLFPMWFSWYHSVVPCNHLIFCRNLCLTSWLSMYIIHSTSTVNLWDYSHRFVNSTEQSCFSLLSINVLWDWFFMKYLYDIILKNFIWWGSNLRFCSFFFAFKDKRICAISVFSWFRSELEICKFNRNDRMASCLLLYLCFFCTNASWVSMIFWSFPIIFNSEGF